MAIDDDGSCVIHFVNVHGRSATRTLAWHELVVIDDPDVVELTEAATATLDRLIATVARRTVRTPRSGRGCAQSSRSISTSWTVEPKRALRRLLGCWTCGKDWAQ